MSPTSKPGSPDPTLEPDTSIEQADDDNIAIPVRLLVLGAIALILALVIGTQVLGVLYVIVFPPAPPLPTDVTLVSHTSSAHGVDEWLYTTTQSACDVVKFYIDNGAVCRIAPTCDDQNPDTGLPSPSVENASQNVARCVGQARISIFSMRWQLIVAVSHDPDIVTEFRLVRDVFWTGGDGVSESTPQADSTPEP